MSFPALLCFDPPASPCFDPPAPLCFAPPALLCFDPPLAPPHIPVHLIRLASPWGRRPNPPESLNGDWERVQIPDVVTKQANDSASLSGSIVYRRTFNRPTNLENQTRVWLVIESLIGQIVGIEFNGQSIEVLDSFPLRISIDQRLQLHNDLRIELAPREGQIGLSGPVRLEIED